jgi:hypothetical protein
MRSSASAKFCAATRAVADRLGRLLLDDELLAHLRQLDRDGRTRIGLGRGRAIQRGRVHRSRERPVGEKREPGRKDRVDRDREGNGEPIRSGRCKSHDRRLAPVSL